MRPAPTAETDDLRLPRRAGAIALAACTILAGCRVHETRAFDRPPVPIPEDWNADAPDPAAAPEDAAPAEADGMAEPVPAPDRWWTAYDDPALDEAVDAALASNLDLRTSWHRLRQAAASARIAGAALDPSLDLAADAGFQRVRDRETPSAGGGRTSTEDWSDVVGIGGALSWELDLWGRLGHRRDAALLRTDAARTDASGTALLVAGGVVETWLRLRELTARLELLDEQVEVGRTLLELTELRFSLGEGSATDVLQQRQQVAATAAEVPITERTLAESGHRLDLLLGRAPGTGPRPGGDALPGLPPFPALEAPASLLLRRPDLQSALLRLRAADHDLGEAIADRLPRLRLGLTYDFSSAAFGDLFQREIGRAVADVTAPILDGGRRRAEIVRREAVLQEQLDVLAAAWLDALGEVEDAIAAEAALDRLLHDREAQVDLARRTLRETRSRYATGLEPYVNVILAVQSLQSLERRILLDRLDRLVNRARLYRALGGRWMDDLEPAVPRDPERAASARTKTADPVPRSSTE